MNEGVVLLANAVEELLRHVVLTSSLSSAEGKTDMETDVEGRDLVSDNDERFSHLSIFHGALDNGKFRNLQAVC